MCPTSPDGPATSSRRNRSAAAPNTLTAPNLQFSPIWFPSKVSAHGAMIKRPDGTDFTASEIYRKPNFEMLPQISPHLFLLSQAGRVRAPAPQPPECEGQRARAPRARGLRGAGDKEAVAPPRPPGPSPRGQLRASNPACAPPLLTRGSGARAPAPAAAAAARTMAGGGARRPEARALCGSRARRLQAD